MEVIDLPLGMIYTQETKHHPLSANWVKDSQPTFRHDTNSKGFKRQIEDWFHAVENTVKVQKLEDNKELLDIHGDINSFLTSTGQIPAYAQLFELDDLTLNNWLMSKTDRNLLKYVKELSKQLFKLYQYALTKDSIRIKGKHISTTSPCESMLSRQIRQKPFRKISNASHNLSFSYTQDSRSAFLPNTPSTLRSWNIQSVRPTSNYDTSPNSSDFEEVPKLLRRARSKSIPSKRNQPQHSQTSCDSTYPLWNSKSNTFKSPKTSLRSKASWTTNLLKGINNKKKQPVAESWEFKSDLEFDDSTIETRSEYELNMAPQPAVEPSKELLMDLFSDSTLHLSEDYSLNLSPTEEFIDTSFYCQEIVELVELPKKTNRNYSRRGSNSGCFPPYANVDFMVLTEINSPPATCTSPIIGVSNLTTLKCSPSLEGLHQSSFPMASTLLTKIIDAQNENTVLSVEKRWSNFMQLHAPPVNTSGKDYVDTHLIASLPHPLASVANLEIGIDTDMEELALNGIEVGYTRQPICLSKLSFEELRELRRLCRTGIPESYRPTIWFQGSGASTLAETNYYRGLLANPCPTYLHIIEMDLPRTIPAHPYFSQSQGGGLAKLRNILVAFATHNPVIGYCQGMNLIAANLLVTLRDEEQVFFTLTHLVETILPPNYYDLKLTDARIDQMVLNQLVRQHLPHLHQHLTQLNVDFTAVTFTWFLSLFCDSNCTLLKLRVWDSLLVEGTSILFWFALAILDLHQPALLSYDCPYQLYTALGKLTNCLTSSQIKSLAKKAFTTYRSKVNFKEITELRDHFLNTF